MEHTIWMENLLSGAAFPSCVLMVSKRFSIQNSMFHLIVPNNKRIEF